MITILLAARGSLKVPAITSQTDLKDALNKLGAVRDDQVPSCPTSCLTWPASGRAWTVFCSQLHVYVQPAGAGH